MVLLDISPLDLKTIDSYRANLRAAARAMWAGHWDFIDFIEGALLAVESGYTQSWREGAAEAGIKPGDYTDEEKDRLRSEIILEQGRLERLADYIEANSKANGGKLGRVFQRVELWAKGYERIRQTAYAMASKDKKLKWVLNPAEHCSSCLKLANKVKRSSFWIAKGVLPKSWNLNCRMNCKCTLEPTDDPLSPGPLPQLP